MSLADEDRGRLGLGYAPAWADAWGEDEYGVFASIVLGEVEQRMRWIPPGKFMMGSPNGEDGRYDHEGPQHEVNLTYGFWMADTACTQALWKRVMNSNPSRFRSPRRPVESVSWKDVHEFLLRLNARVSGLDAELPTEAQWEYACRAGTNTAIYTGPLEVLGHNNAQMLDEIAWYGGNSGQNFDLPPDQGEDSSDWPGKQYIHTRAGTRGVGLKRPNAWGLYDMLGNVWEWCEDLFSPYREKLSAHVDPARGKFRVNRGGSWHSAARHVRAACRLWYGPDDRFADLGFRLVRGQGLTAAREAGTRRSEGAKVRSVDPPVA